MRDSQITDNGGVKRLLKTGVVLTSLGIAAYFGNLINSTIKPDFKSGITKEQAKENINPKIETTTYKEYRVGTVYVPNNVGSISPYMESEGLDYVTRKNISDLVRQLNPDPKLYHSGFKEGEVTFHAGKPIVLPDINCDEKLFGKPMVSIGLETFVLTQDKNGKIVDIDQKEAYNRVKAYSGIK